MQVDAMHKVRGCLLELIEIKNVLVSGTQAGAHRSTDCASHCRCGSHEDQGFQGTIFRFPFRTKYCEASEICRNVKSLWNVANIDKTLF